MNTMTLSETTAVATAVARLAVGQQHRLIPLSKLRPSSRNVRRSGGTAIPELAASIARLGLLQNLAVIASADGEHFDVVAGRRRLTALKLLVKRRKLAKDVEVSCLQVPDVAARTVSLTENVQREAMLGRVPELSCLSFVGHGHGSIYRGTLFDARQGKLALARVGRPVGAPITAGPTDRPLC